METPCSAQHTDCGVYATAATLYVGNNTHIMEAYSASDKEPPKGMFPWVLKVFRTFVGHKAGDVAELRHLTSMAPHPGLLGAPVCVTSLRGFPAAVFPRFPTDLFAVVLERHEELTGGPTLDMCRHVFKQLAWAVKHCHDCGLAHLDIKLENVFVRHEAAGDDGPAHDWSSVRTVLGDFEFAMSTAGRCVRAVGTTGYQAPELLKLRQSSEGSSVAPAPCDVWSLGILLCVVITGQQINFSNGVVCLDYVLSKARKANATRSAEAMSRLQDLLQAMLQPNPRRRATMDDVVSHPWVARE